MLKISKLLHLFVGLIVSKELYKNLEKDEYAKAHTTLFARKALWNLLTLLFAITATVLVAYFISENLYSHRVLLAILCMVAIVPIAVFTFYELIKTLNYVVKQIKLNKKPIGIVALTLFLALIILAVTVIVIIIV